MQLQKIYGWEKRSIKVSRLFVKRMHDNFLRVSPSIYTLSFFIHEQIQYGTESRERAILCYKLGFIDT